MHEYSCLPSSCLRRECTLHMSVCPIESTDLYQNYYNPKKMCFGRLGVERVPLGLLKHVLTHFDPKPHISATRSHFVIFPYKNQQFLNAYKK